MSQSQGNEKAFTLDQALSKVRKLTARAEQIENMDPADLERNYPDPESRDQLKAEADACRLRADGLMLDYAIQEAQIRDAVPEALRSKPAVGEFASAPGSMSGHIDDLMRIVAKHCRCMVRSYTRFDKEENSWMNKVYGYEHDLRYFEVLFTTLRLHMLGAFRPSIDPAASLEENCYRLHNAGFNLKETVRMYGWVEAGIYDERVIAWEQTHPDFDRFADRKNWYYNKETGEVKDLHQLKVFYSAAYRRACKRRGEQYRPSPAGGSASYREDAASGYISTIRQRVRQIEGGRTVVGSELVLSSEGLLDFYREQNPGAFTRCPHCSKLSASPYDCDRCKEPIKPMPKDEHVMCKKCAAASSGYCREHKPMAVRYRKLNEAGYQAGATHARTADLTGNRVGSVKRELH